MTAQEYLDMVLRKKFVPNAEVVVQMGRSGNSYRWSGDKELPDSDDCDIFIRVKDVC